MRGLIKGTVTYSLGVLTAGIVWGTERYFEARSEPKHKIDVRITGGTSDVGDCIEYTWRQYSDVTGTPVDLVFEEIPLDKPAYWAGDQRTLLPRECKGGFVYAAKAEISNPGDFSEEDVFAEVTVMSGHVGGNPYPESEPPTSFKGLHYSIQSRRQSVEQSISLNPHNDLNSPNAIFQITLGLPTLPMGERVYLYFISDEPILYVGVDGYSSSYEFGDKLDYMFE